MDPSRPSAATGVNTTGVSAIREEWQAFLLALQFLTRLPVPAKWTRERMAASLRWHPAAGMVVGAASGTVFLVGSVAFSPSLAALLAVGAGMLLTGALHEDGLADVCDGLGGSAGRAQALDIMRDSRIGTYGTLGLGIVVGGTILALAELPPMLGALTLIAGHAGSRASSVVVVATSRYVRASGAGEATAGRMSRRGAAVALATASLPLLVLALAGGPASLGAGLGGLALGHLLVRRLFERRLGGYTGDCLGAVQQTSAFGFFVGVAAWA